MTFEEYVTDINRRRSLADACKVHEDYIYQIGTKRARCGPLLAIKIEFATQGEYSRHFLRPDIFGLAPSRESA